MAHYDGPQSAITSAIIGAAIGIQKALGPGLLEKAYEEFLAADLQEQGFSVKRQVVFPLQYKNAIISKAYKVDMIINDKVLVELKAIRSLTDSDYAQALTYLRLSGLEVGLLINFNAVPLKTGIKRFIQTSDYNPRTLRLSVTSA